MTARGRLASGGAGGGPVRARGAGVPAAPVAALFPPCGLSLSAGRAKADPRVPAPLALTPGPAEWWLAAWQVRRAGWPLTEGGGGNIGEGGRGGPGPGPAPR